MVGRVFDDAVIARFFSHVDLGPEHDLWTLSTRRGGYGQFYVRTRDDDTLEIMSAHRFAYIVAYGPIAHDVCVLHHCDTPACVRADHLFLGDRGVNAADRAAKGRTYRTPRDLSPHVKLLSADVERARCLVDAGATVRATALQFGVHETTLGIALGRYPSRRH